MHHFTADCMGDSIKKIQHFLFQLSDNPNSAFSFSILCPPFISMYTLLCTFYKLYTILINSACYTPFVIKVGRSILRRVFPFFCRQVVIPTLYVFFFLFSHSFHFYLRILSHFILSAFTIIYNQTTSCLFGKNLSLLQTKIK